MGSDPTVSADRGPGASGEVVEILPASTYVVELADRRRVVAHLASAVQRGFVRLRLRDRVDVELTSSDPNRGRIVKVLKND